ncbi:MAG: hypothetical protein PVF58_04155 [Candidatus Methanofastidiosia archaeon]
MSRDSVILKILIAIFGFAIICMIAYEIAQCQFSTSEVSEPEIFCIELDRNIPKLNDALAVFLQDLGEFLNLVAIKDSKWFMICYSTGFFHQIYSTNKRLIEWDRGGIFQAKLKKEKDSSKDKITPIFKKSFLVEFLRCFSFFPEVIK